MLCFRTFFTAFCAVTDLSVQPRLNITSYLHTKLIREL